MTPTPPRVRIGDDGEHIDLCGIVTALAHLGVHLEQPTGAPAYEAGTGGGPDAAASATGGLLEGPWRHAVWVALGAARSKSDHRRSGNRKAARSEWERLRAFEEELSGLLRLHALAGWDPGSTFAEQTDAVTAVARRLRDRTGHSTASARITP